MSFLYCPKKGVVLLFDTVIIGKKDSLQDYDASMKEREIGEPKKKSIKETVPFSNKIYDFTKIDGEVYWEERPLTYIFEITADTPEELEDKKSAFKTWIMNVHEEKLYDPYIENHHFIATFDEISCDDSEIEKSTITVDFTAYPYMMSNDAKVYTFALNANSEKKVMILNKSSHRITPTIISDVNVTIQMNDSSYSFSSGETTSSSFCFEMGTNEVTILAGSSGKVTFKFYEEVL